MTRCKRRTLGNVIAASFITLAASLGTLDEGQLTFSALAHAAPADTTVDATEVLQLDMGKGTLIRLKRPVSGVFIANPDVADIQVRNPYLIYLFGKTNGTTSFFAVDDDDRVVYERNVHVTHNLEGLSHALTQAFPGHNVTVNSMDRAMILSGTADNASQADAMRQMASAYLPDGHSLINQVAVQGPVQVNLRVRVAEMSREITKQLGLNADISGGIGGGSTIGAALGSAAAYSGSTAIVRTDGVMNLFAGLALGNFNINLVLEALEKEGLTTVMAEPNLTAKSGETASFLAGGEFPILVPQGNDTLAITFRKYGVSLAFTPTLVGKNRISLHVKPEVSQLSSAGAINLGGYSVPSLTTRRAETTVELGSGQSFAIAGLIQNDITQTLNKFPGLGDVPMLGALFRSEQFLRNETELVIIVTPYLVRPATQQMTAPTDGYRPPHDMDRLIYGTDFAALDKRIIGPVGFEIE